MGIILLFIIFSWVYKCTSNQVLWSLSGMCDALVTATNSLPEVGVSVCQATLLHLGEMPRLQDAQTFYSPF